MAEMPLTGAGLPPITPAFGTSIRRNSTNTSCAGTAAQPDSACWIWEREPACCHAILCGIWTGTDISENQVAKARELSAGMPIDYTVSSAETVSFPDNTFDGITACQCYWYFDDAKVAPRLFRMLKPGGKLLLLCMAWLPFEDPVACASEQLVLRYSPNWSGAGETLHPIPVSPDMQRQLRLTFHEEYLLDVPFTRESWNGRMKACRGIGASLPPEQIARWEQEHRKMLAELAPEHFTVRHYAALAELQKPE